MSHDDKGQRHIDQLQRWCGLNGLAPLAVNEVILAFAEAMGGNEYGVEETWDAFCWFRNGFNSAGAKASAPVSATRAIGPSDVSPESESRGFHVLAKEIGECAQRAGLYNGEGPLDGPSLILLLNDMADWIEERSKPSNKMASGPEPRCHGGEMCLDPEQCYEAGECLRHQLSAARSTVVAKTCHVCGKPATWQCPEDAGPAGWHGADLCDTCRCSCGGNPRVEPAPLNAGADIHGLLGNIIDHWEGTPNDIKSDPGMERLNRAVRNANAALSHGGHKT